MSVVTCDIHKQDLIGAFLHIWTEHLCKGKCLVPGREARSSTRHVVAEPFLMIGILVKELPQWLLERVMERAKLSCFFVGELMDLPLLYIFGKLCANWEEQIEAMKLVNAFGRRNSAMERETYWCFSPPIIGGVLMRYVVGLATYSPSPTSSTTPT